VGGLEKEWKTMTNGTTPPPPIPTPAKKGLSPWVWLGIGCAGIIVISLVGFTIAGYFLYGKAREVARDMEEDPVATTARIIAAANPEIELVDADADHRTVTFRNTETGEEFVFDYDDIEEGRFELESGDESTSIELDTDAEGGGGMTIRTDDGETMTYGTAAGGPPEWVPVYPGTEPQGTYASDTPEMRTGAFTFETDDELENVLDFYESELEASGFTIRNRTTTPEGALLVATTDGEARSATLTATLSDDGVGGMVNFTEKK
jgi:hypothetical protein